MGGSCLGNKHVALTSFVSVLKDAFNGRFLGFELHLNVGSWRYVVGKRCVLGVAHLSFVGSVLEREHHRLVDRRLLRWLRQWWVRGGMCVHGWLLCGAGVVCVTALGLVVSLLKHHFDLLRCVATMQQQQVFRVGAEM